MQHHETKAETRAAEAKAEAKADAKAKATTKVDITAELEAVRQRIAAKRRRGFKGTQEPFTTTDLADMEFLLVALDTAMGNKPLLTPAEADELYALQQKRELTDPIDIEVRNRIAGKGDTLTPEELVMRDHLNAKADAQLTEAELARLAELTAKSKK